MVLLRCVLLSATIASSAAFQTLFSNFQAHFGASSKQSGAKQLEDQLLAAIAEQDRLSTSDEIDAIVMQLEASNKSLQRPAIAPEVYGRWRLMHTTNAATASPMTPRGSIPEASPLHATLSAAPDVFLLNLVDEEVMRQQGLLRGETPPLQHPRNLFLIWEPLPRLSRALPGI